jgi:putative transposase
MCSILQVSRSAYYGGLSRWSHQYSDTDRKFSESVREVFQIHKRRNGSCRIMYELRKYDLCVSRKKVFKTMQKLEFKTIQLRSYIPRTKDSRYSSHLNENLHLHSKPASSPNMIWVGDITYIPMQGADGDFCTVDSMRATPSVCCWAHM